MLSSFPTFFAPSLRHQMYLASKEEKENTFSFLSETSRHRVEETKKPGRRKGPTESREEREDRARQNPGFEQERSLLLFSFSVCHRYQGKFQNSHRHRHPPSQSAFPPISKQGEDHWEKRKKTTKLLHLFLLLSWCLCLPLYLDSKDDKTKKKTAKESKKERLRRPPTFLRTAREKRWKGRGKKGGLSRTLSSFNTVREIRRQKRTSEEERHLTGVRKKEEALATK